ncbi:probable hexosyltransferase MUCI70 [Arachis hypogaea]|uniref:probable hexosyltransferase MUCI70 n=1 Tax=Arachis hypogaea TaxID=3818 RepID=UPI003B21C18D
MDDKAISGYVEHNDDILLVVIPASQAPEIFTSRSLSVAKEYDAESCPVCYLPVEEAIELMPKPPSPSPVLKNLTYIYEENISRFGEFGGSNFGGYPTLKMEKCNGVVVASAIFENFDEINEPADISTYSKETVCFLMFVDEETEKYIKSSGKLGSSKMIGLWRIIIAHNLPYTDARRTGKIPKLLLHRLVPNAHCSIWVDGKLKLKKIQEDRMEPGK